MATRRFARACALGAALLLSSALGSSFQHDNVKGRALNFVTHPIRPFAKSADGARLYVANQGGARLAVFDPLRLVADAEIPVTLGVVSVVERASDEIWLVDAIQHSVLVVDPTTQTIEHTIRVGAEPHGLVFTPDSSRAYVACSAANRIDVIDAHAKRLVHTISVPAMNPRAVEWLDGRVWIASFRSGNNTAVAGSNSGSGLNRIVRVRDLAEYPALNQLPDRDLFSITPAADPKDDVLDATVHRGIGTLLFDLRARPGTTELWIPNTEAHNASFRGEGSFVEGQVVSNRITILDVSDGSKTIVDLDELAPPGQECAQPVAVNFTANGRRAFVSGFCSDAVAVLDIDAAGDVTWSGEIRLTADAGPRGTLLSNDEKTLYVYGKLNDDLLAVPLDGYGVQREVEPIEAQPVHVGFNPVNTRERHGRKLFARGSYSKSRTSACVSCHVDGTNDGLAWDLSTYLDPEGTDPDELQFGIDVKGPLVTQNTLRLGETAPYHWRGDRASLFEFDATFAELLENQESGVTAGIGEFDFAYVVAYMRDLPYPANPRQQLDRSLTSRQARGEELFRTAPAFQGLACIDCHALPLGTSGELVAFKLGGSAKTGVVRQLRGVGDKPQRPFTIGGPFGTRTDVGTGLLHGGAAGGLRALLEMEDPDLPGVPLFQFSPSEIDDLIAYLQVFDTGLAPATTFAFTAHAHNAVESQAALELLIGQAQAGNCDLVCRRSPLQGTPLVHRSLCYDVAKAAFVPAAKGGALVGASALLAEAAGGLPVTFIGVPLLTGYQMALDRDVDGLFDLDEAAAGSDPEDFDSDGDKLPDGYEVAFGLDPLHVDPGCPADTTAPSLVATPTIVYTTGTALKLDYATDELATVYVSVDGTRVIKQPQRRGFDREFSVVLGELSPGQSYDIGFEMFDPVENYRIQTFTFSTRPPQFAEGVRVTAIRPEIASSFSRGRPQLEVAVHLAQGASPAAAGYVVRVSVDHRRKSDGALTRITGAMPAVVVTEAGRVLLRTELPLVEELGGTGRLFVTVQDVAVPMGAALYVEGLDAVRSVELLY